MLLCVELKLVRCGVHIFTVYLSVKGNKKRDVVRFVVFYSGWSWLLSRKSLLKASKHLKEICGQCNLSYPHDVPCILSACLVSLEPDACLRLMPDQFTPDERFSQQSVKCQLSTPQDVTCTHILVFPTSATTQVSAENQLNQMLSFSGSDKTAICNRAQKRQKITYTFTKS